MRGPLIVISGPAGVGKSTVVKELLADTTLPLWQSVSATTRPPRTGEVDGRDYFFWTEERFKRAIAEGTFLEYAQVHGRHWYGTPAEEVERRRARGLGVVLVIDVQGFAQVRAKTEDVLSIFLKAPLDELEKRIRARGGDDESSVQARLNTARMELGRAGEYNYRLTNDDLNKTVADLRALIAGRFEAGGAGGASCSTN